MSCTSPLNVEYYRRDLINFFYSLSICLQWLSCRGAGKLFANNTRLHEGFTYVHENVTSCLKYSIFLY